METVTLTVNGREIKAQPGQFVLEAALNAGIYIPHLCHHPDLSPIGACRLCIVDIDGVDDIQTSCTTHVAANMIVHTRSERLDKMRKLAMELLLAGHQKDCGTCVKYLNCELQSLKQLTATRIVHDDDRLQGVELLDVESFCFDDDSGLQICTVEGSQQIVDADTVIFAVGQRPDIPGGFDLDLTESGLIALDPYMFSTSREEIFAAGDAVHGTTSVIDAIASGRKAAIAVDKYLGGSGRIDATLAPVEAPAQWLGPGDGFAAMDRCEQTCLLPEDRVRSFCNVLEDMDETEAVDEATRCLRCDLRLKMTQVKFWDNYKRYDN